MVEDLLMVINITVSVLMIGSVIYVYRQKLEWKEAKPIFMVTVPLYVYMSHCLVLLYFTLYFSSYSAFVARLSLLVRAPPLEVRYVFSFLILERGREFANFFTVL